MRRETSPERPVLRVLDPELSTGLFHEFRDRRVIDMAQPGEEVVLDLEIQAADEPRDNSAPPGEVHGGFRLMDRPRVLDAPSFLPGQRKLRLFHAMCDQIGRASCRKECRSRWSPYH